MREKPVDNDVQSNSNICAPSNRDLTNNETTKNVEKDSKTLEPTNLKETAKEKIKQIMNTIGASEKQAIEILKYSRKLIFSKIFVFSFLAKLLEKSGFKSLSLKNKFYMVKFRRICSFIYETNKI